MGCDIHSRIEIKKNGKWEQNQEPLFKNPYNFDKDPAKEMIPSWGDSRQYDWFSVLADVRNGSGFAGCKTGEGFVPIAEPRGIPKDATEEWKNYCKDWGGDLHSKGYLTISDFENYDWNRSTKKYGVISLSQYTELRGTNKSPESWCGGIGGGKNITVSEEDADKILSGETVEIVGDGDSSYDNRKRTINLASDFTINVRYSWEINYKDWFEYNLTNLIEPMKKLKEKYEDVRVVFGFDN